MALRTGAFQAIDGRADGVSVPQLVVGVLGCLWGPCVAYRAWRSSRVPQQLQADRGTASGNVDDGRVILPCYAALVYLATATTVLHTVLALVTASSTSDWAQACVSAAAWGLHRVPLEGLTIFLVQSGAGERAMKRAVVAGALLGALNVAAFIFGFQYLRAWGFCIIAGWCGTMGLLYAMLWLVPESVLHPRPALTPYTGYWTVFWSMLTVAYVLDALDDAEGRMQDAATILYFLSHGIMSNLITPSVLYSAALEDSMFWQGVSYKKRAWWTQLTAPLEGIQFSSVAATGLADGLDTMTETSAVKHINYSALQLKPTLLGAGGQARVYLGLYHCRPVAVKVVLAVELTPEVVQDFCNEAKLLCEMTHPNIVKLHGICVVPPTIAIVMELCSHGSLGEVLRGRRSVKLTWRAKLQLCRDCANAIAFLHSKGVVHKDIKSANFLVDGSMTAKLADLGVSDYVSPDMSCGSEQHHAIEMTKLNAPAEFRGTVAYAAPEVLSGQRHTTTADVYSLALVLWEVLSTQLPFDMGPVSRLGADALTSAVCGRGDWRQHRPPGVVDDRWTVDGLRPVLPSNTPSDFADLLAAGWAPSPSARPSANQLLTSLESMIQKLSVCEFADQVHAPSWPASYGDWISSAPHRVSTPVPLARATSLSGLLSLRPMTRQASRDSECTTINPLTVD